MIVYRIVVAYDGTDYQGWQYQPNATTVSGTLMNAFQAVFVQQASILGASRTDTGVHALNQVAIVRTTIDMDTDTMLRAWSKAIPSDIVIQKIQKLPHLVHPHAGVVAKTYAYHFFLERPSPFCQRYGWFIYKPINLDILRKALSIFVGTHDFRSFCTVDDLTDTMRTIDSLNLYFVPAWNAYKIEVKGKSFLRYMVRRIVGACLTVALDLDMNIEYLQKVLNLKNPCHTLPNAPAKGLLLEKIEYQGVEIYDE